MARNHKAKLNPYIVVFFKKYKITACNIKSCLCYLNLEPMSNFTGAHIHILDVSKLIKNDESL